MNWTPEDAPERFNIARYCLAENARRFPSKVALIIVSDDGVSQQWTYAEVDRAVRRLAGGLREMGARPGQCLMIRMDNDWRYVFTFFAAMAVGLIAFPSSAALTEIEAAALLADSEAAFLAISGDLAFHHSAPESLRVLSCGAISRMIENGSEIDYADTAAIDPAFLIYTSGTTGRPKGVLHGHRTAWGRRPMHQGWYGIAFDDVVLHAGAFNWTYTLGVGLLDPWANGATAVLYNGRSNPEIWPDIIQHFQVTLFATVPSLYRRILKYSSDIIVNKLATLRHALTAGETLPPPLLEAWLQRTGKPLYEALGMSEISTYISTGPGMLLKPGSPGRPQEGRRVAILDSRQEASESPRLLPPGEIGLIAVHRSDPGLMLGYWRRPEEEALVYRGEWFAGGDLAHIDEDGYVWFHGRNDDILKISGYRLSPTEIERVLSRHPSVADVAVGECAVSADLSVLTAFVVRAVACEETDILDWAADHLAVYKLPRKVVFMDNLPRTSNGKLRRKELPREFSSCVSSSSFL
ncbi:AMP-dependent synthetase and ligase [Azospirillaceae bacterium]